MKTFLSANNTILSRYRERTRIHNTRLHTFACVLSMLRASCELQCVVTSWYAIFRSFIIHPQFSTCHLSSGISYRFAFYDEILFVKVIPFSFALLLFELCTSYIFLIVVSSYQEQYTFLSINEMYFLLWKHCIDCEFGKYEKAFKWRVPRSIIYGFSPWKFAFPER